MIYSLILYDNFTANKYTHSFGGHVCIVKHCCYTQPKHQFKKDMVDWCKSNLPEDQFAANGRHKEFWTLLEFEMMDKENDILGLREKVILVSLDKPKMVLAKLVWGGEVREYPYNSLNQFFYEYDKKSFDL